MSYNDKKNLGYNNEKRRKIKAIKSNELNKECFDCGACYPQYISINNGIFICKDCLKIHNNFPKQISNTLKNNLSSLNSKELEFMYIGGNQKLLNFINYEYPQLQRYKISILYQTKAMQYYRNNLNYLVNGGIKPIKPSELINAYELINIKEAETKKENINTIKKINNNTYKTTKRNKSETILETVNKKIREKNLMTLAAVLCCAMTMTVFTACSSDDDNTPKEPEIKGIGAVYFLSVTEQMSQLCDYTITYYGVGGKLETETATWSVNNGVATWEKMVTSTIMPATFGIKVSANVKASAQLEGVKVENIYPITEKMYVEGITTDGKTAWEKNVPFHSGQRHGSISGAKLQASLDAMENHGGMVNKCYTYDKDGREITSGSIQ